MRMIASLLPRGDSPDHGVQSGEGAAVELIGALSYQQLAHLVRELHGGPLEPARLHLAKARIARAPQLSSARGTSGAPEVVARREKAGRVREARQRNLAQ